jgi:hypothetical protein
MKESGSPTPMAGRAKALTFTLKPRRATIHAVNVVPMLAPMITPMAWVRVIRFAETKLTTITVLAELDWTTTVMINPVTTAMNRLDVRWPSKLLSLEPATFWRASDMIFMPKRNTPNAPRSRSSMNRVAMTSSWVPEIAGPPIQASRRKWTV